MEKKYKLGIECQNPMCRMKYERKVKLPAPGLLPVECCGVCGSSQIRVTMHLVVLARLMGRK